MALVQQQLARLGRVNRHNLHTLRHAPAAEISGALGDLGTLLPLMIALALQGSIDLPSTLVFSGLFNMATGMVFGIPLPVQPMKAIAAAALASGSSMRTTTAAGAWVSIFVLVLSITGLLRWLTARIPVPIVKGIQLGAGLSLIISAGTTLVLPLGWTSPALDNRLWAILVFIGLLLTTTTTTTSKNNKHRLTIPFALVVFLLGLTTSFITILLHRNKHNLPHVSPYTPHLSLPSFLAPSALNMAISQLPLTTLNSIIAAAALSSDLFPSDPPSAPSTTALGLSVAAMNLAGCWFGAMPVCHGAGGLAAQHRFGARSGASVVLLGAVKMVLGLVFGSSLLGLLRAFPRCVLGVMVFAAGAELARAGASLNDDVDGEEEREERWTVMLTTAAGILAFRNDGVGFAAGVVCFLSYRVKEVVERRWAGGVLAEGRPLLR
ncbi:sulfate transporter [Podospora appendiculata]|uniref:Sulfate transporter n=1 Tax=Podospora appendiculata TaxID=314037 RepID=A0AAE0X4Q3_9PEZI|nr:sulfate transporter [Podospora appendiculata]